MLAPLSTDHSVAVIGAGLAGLACGQVLASHGINVMLFDKARGPGGRMSSKRRPSATLDLAAQAFSVRDADFQRAVDEWIAIGCIAPWPSRTYQASSSGWQALNDSLQRYTGAPRMSALTRHLADSLTALPNAALTTSTPIAALKQMPNGWLLVDADNTVYGPFDQVVISAPPPQAQALVAPWDAKLAAACEERKQRACWAGWAIFDEPLPPMPSVDPEWQMARADHPALRLISRNQTKPGRESQPESLSLLAQLDWSETQLEQSTEVIAEQLLTALKSVLPRSVLLPPLTEIGAHRWRYAQPAAPHNDTYLYGSSGLALCGDSFRDGRVEDAWLSGHRLGQALIGRSV
ncbi:MAG: FAD-binding protein [Halomonas sp.]|nr:MAG: FAD-binding protein [Halomonas sp.]